MTQLDTTYLAVCWRITRIDGEVLRLTNHDEALVFEGNLYDPTDGIASSAREIEEGFKGGNASFVGALSSSKITEADLRAGRYKNAVVEEFVLDWRMPFNGAYVKYVWLLVEPRWTEDSWQCEVAPLTSQLDRIVGDKWTKSCRYDFGETRCGVDVDALAETKTVASVSSSDPKRVFTPSTAFSPPSSDFANLSFGKVTFTSGDNDGLSFDVKSVNSGTSQVVLYKSAPFNIAVSDTFELRPGCDKRRFTCKNVYNNNINFGGFPFLPGRDRASTTPNYKV